MNLFRPFKVVGRGSETQLQVGEKLNYLIQRFKGLLGTSYMMHKCDKVKSRYLSINKNKIINK